MQKTANNRGYVASLAESLDVICVEYAVWAIHFIIGTQLMVSNAVHVAICNHLDASYQSETPSHSPSRDRSSCHWYNRDWNSQQERMVISGCTEEIMEVRTTKPLGNREVRASTLSGNTMTRKKRFHIYLKTIRIQGNLTEWQFKLICW